jgi:hypothetical protein
VAGDVYLAVNGASIALLAGIAATAMHGAQKDAVGPSWDNHRRQQDSVTTPWVITGLAAVGTVGAIQSARYGLQSARDCDDARESYFLRIGAQPSVWYPPPNGYPPPAPPTLPAQEAPAVSP